MTTQTTTTDGRVFACANCGAGLFTLAEVRGHQAQVAACRPKPVDSCEACGSELPLVRSDGWALHRRSRADLQVTARSCGDLTCAKIVEARRRNGVLEPLAQQRRVD